MSRLDLRRRSDDADVHHSVDPINRSVDGDKGGQIAVGLPL
jgi:hypothetical protein